MESIGTLSGGIAHEFNNILSIIIGNNEIAMAEMPDTNPVKENLEDIQVAAMRAGDIVKQLLMFSRKEDGMRKPVDLTRVVQDAIQLIHRSIPADITIRQAVSQQVPPILGNATQINQLLINLCANARDAMPDKEGEISIELSHKIVDEQGAESFPGLKPGGYVQLRVGDNGCGIEQEMLDRIFDPFFTTKAVGKGTGIGLAVVHGIVKRHDGFLFVDSQTDQGTTFTMLFPVCLHALAKGSDKIQQTLPTGNERILLVDDENSILKLGIYRLEKLGYRVVGTRDPKEALTLFQADPGAFDLVITDMAMPHMTGAQLAVEIMKIRAKMPVMLCTGYSETISEEDADDIGICAFAMKPLKLSDFAAKVRSVLDDVKHS